MIFNQFSLADHLNNLHYRQLPIANDETQKTGSKDQMSPEERERLLELMNRNSKFMGIPDDDDE